MMRAVHRYIAVFVVLFAVYVSSTGLLTQTVDLQALLRRAPATDPTMQAIRVGQGGPPNFKVMRDPDYAAAAMPAGFDYDAALAKVTASARTALGDAPRSFVEFRMLDGRPAVRVASQGRIWPFDATTGAVAGATVPVTLAAMEQPSLRNQLKSFHRLGMFGPWAYALDLLMGLGLCAMMVTGAVMYVRMLTGRVRQGRYALYWSAGGWWRALHRTVGAVAVVFLSVLVLSGTFLAFNALAININKALAHGKRPGLTADVSSPLTDAELPSLLHVTLGAYGRGHPGVPPRVVRLRYFAGMPQGVVITSGPEATQLVFNAATGQPASEAEPGYPQTGMPFGWRVGQIVKQIHRGDLIGLPGRVVAVLAGASLLYLAVSGVVVYLDLWRRRRKMGRPGLFWA
jgi:uncharacterized iron-regulated membrane protein